MTKAPIESRQKSKADESCVAFVSPPGPPQVKAKGPTSIQRGAEVSWAWEMVMVMLMMMAVMVVMTTEMEIMMMEEDDGAVGDDDRGDDRDDDDDVG